MGRSYTPTYRIEYTDNTSTGVKSMAWDCKRNGRPSVENIEAWRKQYNRSFAPGGVNEHVSKMYGFVVVINSATIIRQKTGEEVAGYIASAFEVA